MHWSHICVHRDLNMCMTLDDFGIASTGISHWLVTRGKRARLNIKSVFPTDINPALVQILHWRPEGDKPWCRIFPTHKCDIWSRWPMCRSMFSLVSFRVVYIINWNYALHLPILSLCKCILFTNAYKSVTTSNKDYIYINYIIRCCFNGTVVIAILLQWHGNNSEANS